MLDKSVIVSRNIFMVPLSNNDHILPRNWAASIARCSCRPRLYYTVGNTRLIMRLSSLWWRESIACFRRWPRNDFMTYMCKDETFIVLDMERLHVCSKPKFIPRLLLTITCIDYSIDVWTYHNIQQSVLILYTQC